MQDQRPIIVWFRRDFRLSDHRALSAACRQKVPIIPVFIHDETVEALGAAPKWRIGLAVEKFAESLKGLGSKLVLRRGAAVAEILKLAEETNAQAVYWSRAYLPDQIKRDTDVKAALQAKGLTGQSFTGHLLFEPWKVSTKTGGYYRVFTPMWKAVRNTELPATEPTVTQLITPEVWPESAELADWGMARAMDRGAAVVRSYAAVGEDAAHSQLERFLSEAVDNYTKTRTFRRFMELHACRRT